MKTVDLTIKSFVLTALVIAFLAVLPVNAETRQRPFSDWLDAQGSLVDPATCASTVLGWATFDLATFARADYSGKIGECITNNGGPVFTPDFSGTVTERDLEDGTAEILVVHHFADTYVVARDQTLGGNPSPAILGYNADELFGNPGMESALASGMIQVKFIIPFPGAPLLDLRAVNALTISSRFRGQGPLRAAFGVAEGTPGRVMVSQTGLTVPGQGNGVADSFPAELVRVFQAGN